MKINLRILFALVTLLIFHSSCGFREQVIEIDIPPHEAKLVANGMFTPDSLWVVHVSASKGIADPSQYELLENATVEIRKNGRLLTSLFYVQQGYYASFDSLPKAGETYTLHVSDYSLGGLTASDQIPFPIPLLSVSKTDSVGTNEFGEGTGEVRFEFQDPGGLDNYYEVSLYLRIMDVIGTDTTYQLVPLGISTDEPGLEIESTFPGLVFDDAIFNGERKVIRLNVSSSDLRAGTEFVLILASLSENYYRYSISIARSMQANGSPFAEPVFIHSNADGGIGIFAGFSKHSFLFR